MSDELKLAVALEFTKGSISIKCEPGRLSLTVSGTKFCHGVQTVGTTEEPLSVGDMTNPGFVLLINRDSSNFVTVRSGTGANSLIKINAGEFALFRLAVNAPYIIADTGACNVEYVVIEN